MTYSLPMQYSEIETVEEELAKTEHAQGLCLKTYWNVTYYNNTASVPTKRRMSDSEVRHHIKTYSKLCVIMNVFTHSFIASVFVTGRHNIGL